MPSADALFVVVGKVWVTDGTEAGTFALPITPDTGYESTGLVEPGGGFGLFFQQFGTKLILFNSEGPIHAGTQALQIYRRHSRWNIGVHRNRYKQPRERYQRGRSGSTGS